ncbi:hypothetical protein MIR68_006683 [Amoeboaphelidium protococcarum]|nr:hypothetical protein MIR68_006683 [Amoeboaphelidium protococcarum]
MTAKKSQVKLVLLGEAAVGKSSIVSRFVKGEFQDVKESTIGAAFLTQRCRIPEDPDRVIKFEVWDTAGQERFNSLAPMYYRNAQAAIVVYDVTKPQTLDKAKYWIQELKQLKKPELVLVLAGNKSDLVPGITDPAKVDQLNRLRDEAEAYSQEQRILYFETSAKTGSNIVEMFTDIARNLPLELRDSQSAVSPAQSLSRSYLFSPQSAGRSGSNAPSLLIRDSPGHLDGRNDYSYNNNSDSNCGCQMQTNFIHFYILLLC